MVSGLGCTHCRVSVGGKTTEIVESTDSVHIVDCHILQVVNCVAGKIDPEREAVAACGQKKAQQGSRGLFLDTDNPVWSERKTSH